MPLTTKQQYYLQEMGIGLWQPKVNTHPIVNNNAQQNNAQQDVQQDSSKQRQLAQERNNNTVKQAPTKKQTAILLTEKELSSQFFHDLLLILHVSKDDINITENSLGFSNVIWQLADQSNEIVLTQFTEQPFSSKQTDKKIHIITPTFTVLSQSTALKAQLWQHLQNLTTTH